jgi:hypothetical protein
MLAVVFYAISCRACTSITTTTPKLDHVTGHTAAAHQVANRVTPFQSALLPDS